MALLQQHLSEHMLAKSFSRAMGGLYWKFPSLQEKHSTEKAAKALHNRKGREMCGAQYLIPGIERQNMLSGEYAPRNAWLAHS